jgi:hypothetical protein
LAALEIELVRARLAQIRSEIRYANTLLGFVLPQEGDVLGGRAVGAEHLVEVIN